MISPHTVTTHNPKDTNATLPAIYEVIDEMFPGETAWGEFHWTASHKVTKHYSTPDFTVNSNQFAGYWVTTMSAGLQAYTPGSALMLIKPSHLPSTLSIENFGFCHFVLCIGFMDA